MAQSKGDAALHGGTSDGDPGGPGGEAGSELRGGTPPDSQLPENFKANEPKAKSGVDEEGKPDDSLNENQVERAATEAILALRPQPTGNELRGVLNLLRDRDDKGNAKHKFKTAADAGSRAVELLNETRRRDAQTRPQDSHTQSAEGGRTSDTATSQRTTTP